jgi:hypothetical protein
MYEYDCAVMRDTGEGFVCIENTVILENLSESEELDLTDLTYVIRDVSPTEVHIIVNRMDVEALQLGSDKFWETR